MSTLGLGVLAGPSTLLRGDDAAGISAARPGLTFVPASELAERIRTREASAVEVLEAHLDQSGRHWRS